MENKRPVNPSPPSSLDHLFGPKDSRSSFINGIVEALLPSSKVAGWNSNPSGTIGTWNYGSSIHYGGQENYSINTTTTTTITESPTTYNDEEDDDLNGNNFTGASRGNWWQGSLYY